MLRLVPKHPRLVVVVNLFVRAQSFEKRTHVAIITEKNAQLIVRHRSSLREERIDGVFLLG